MLEPAYMIARKIKTQKTATVVNYLTVNIANWSEYGRVDDR